MQEELERLYRAFERHPPVPSLSAVAETGEAEEWAAILARPLRSLPEIDVDRLLWLLRAPEDPAAYRAAVGYVLPRVVELLLGRPRVVDAMAKLWELLEHQRVSSAEQAALEGVLRAWWGREIERSLAARDGLERRALLEMLGRIVDDLGPFLSAWSNEALSGQALGHLATFVRSWEWHPVTDRDRPHVDALELRWRECVEAWIRGPVRALLGRRGPDIPPEIAAHAEAAVASIPSRWIPRLLGRMRGPLFLLLGS